VLDSALCMDKHFMKIVLAAAGVPVSPSVTISRARWERDPDGVRADAATLGEPSFVKPARAGSSVGVSKVHDASELDAAMALAFAEDDKVLIEKAIVGREVEVAILEGRGGAAPRASLPGEIVLTTREFYDFEGKYLGGDGADVVCPADLTHGEIAAIQQLGIRAFQAVDGKGLARVDFFLTADGVYVNELNTMPGFTPISMFPKCWVASGLSYGDLISELIEAGLRR
jgi:D-alanine-D-alanine ligase